MTTHVLVLCTHNSARSILGEAMLNHWAGRLGKDVRAHSAGSAPKGMINPHALACLEDAGIGTALLRSKGWDEFTGAEAKRMRIVITVCDSAAAETCPYWPGSPVKAHWGYPDPSNAAAANRAQAFALTRAAIGYRVLQLLALPLDDMDDARLQAALSAIAIS